MKNLTTISLFAGGGGMTLGTSAAGFETLFATDMKPSAEQTFRQNFPDLPFFAGDIRNLTRDRLEKTIAGRKVDLIVGGPPCQGFSTIGD